MSLPRIKHVRAFVSRGKGAGYYDQGEGHWIDDHIATPMARYPEDRQAQHSFGINVLGGAVRDELQFHATGARPDVAKELGFIGGKMPLHHGPAEGLEGMARNIAERAEMRVSVGEDFWLMWDCWMSLDLDYATRLAHRAYHECGLKWIEEALSPDDYWGYAELKKSVPKGLLVTTCEHERPAGASAC